MPWHALPTGPYGAAIQPTIDEKATTTQKVNRREGAEKLQQTGELKSEVLVVCLCVCVCVSACQMIEEGTDGGAQKTQCQGRRAKDQPMHVKRDAKGRGENLNSFTKIAS